MTPTLKAHYTRELKFASSDARHVKAVAELLALGFDENFQPLESGGVLSPAPALAIQPAPLVVSQQRAPVPLPKEAVEAEILPDGDVLASADAFLRTRPNLK